MTKARVIAAILQNPDPHDRQGNPPFGLKHSTIGGGG
jgi:hypothetical protein